MVTKEELDDIMFAGWCLGIITYYEYLENTGIIGFSVSAQRGLLSLENKFFIYFSFHNDCTKFKEVVLEERDWIHKFHENFKFGLQTHEGYLYPKGIEAWMEKIKQDTIEYWIEHGKRIEVITKYIFPYE